MLDREGWLCKVCRIYITLGNNSRDSTATDLFSLYDVVPIKQFVSGRNTLEKKKTHQKQTKGNICEEMDIH